MSNLDKTLLLPFAAISGDPDLDVSTLKVPEYELPSFINDDAELFFSILENVFKQYRIRSSDRMFFMAVNRLPPSVVLEIKDLIINKPLLNPYEALKTRVLEIFVQSDLQTLSKMLEEETLGERKPSNLFRRLKNLADKLNCGSKYTRGLFLKKLPHHIRQGLIGFEHLSDDDLVKLADKHFDNKPETAGIAEVSSNLESLVIARVDAAMAGIQQNHHDNYSRSSQSRRQNRSHYSSNSFNSRSFRPSRSTNRSYRSPSPARRNIQEDSVNNDLCYYHNRFGDGAIKCQQPCTRFPTSSASSGN